MVSGKFMEHLAELVSNLADANQLRRAGFTLPAVGNLEGGLDFLNRSCRKDNDLIYEILEEDEYASLYGDSTTSLLAARATRAQWMYSWPGQMSCGLVASLYATKAVEKFLVDEAWCFFRAFKNRNTHANQNFSEKLFGLKARNFTEQNSLQDYGTSRFVLFFFVLE